MTLIRARSVAIVSIAALTLSACVSTGGVSNGRSSRPSTGMRPATDPHTGGTARPPAGAEGLGGRDQPALIRMFGQPRLNIREGTGVRLQFRGERCVLDTYLYPARDGAAPVVTHVDARTPDGADADRAACISALQRR